MKGRISVTGIDNANRRKKKLTLKNNAPFRSCISKISNTFIDNAEDLDIVMPVYNLLEYTDNYSWHQEVCGIIAEMKWMILLMKIIMQIIAKQQQVNLMSVRQF